MSIDTLDAAQMLQENDLSEKQARAIVKVIRWSESGEWRMKVERELGQIKAIGGFIIALNISISVMMIGAWITYIVS